MNQKDAVYLAIRQLKPTEVDSDRPVKLTKQEKKIVEAKLFDGFRKGRIQYNNELPSDDKLALYVSGLVSNWLRKDRRLNGDTQYVPRRPRTASTLKHLPESLSNEDIKTIKKMTAPGEEVTVYVVRRKVDGATTSDQHDEHDNPEQ